MDKRSTTASLHYDKRGAVLAGDGSAPMAEREASTYVVDLEAFHVDQVAYIDQARQALQSGGGSVAPLGSATLGSASLPGSLSGPTSSLFGSGSLGGPSLGGGGSLGSPSLGGPASFGSIGSTGSGGGSIGSANLGNSPFGSGKLSVPSLGGGHIGSASLGAGSFSNGFAQSSLQSGGSLGTSSFGSGSLQDTSGTSLGTSAIPKMGGGGFNPRFASLQGGTIMHDSLTNFGAAKLDTNILRGL